VKRLKGSNMNVFPHVGGVLSFPKLGKIDKKKMPKVSGHKNPGRLGRRALGNIEDPAVSAKN
jgi:hypothetical protein